jgi:transcriptional regulator with XRE-family HTH domain
VDDLKVGEWVRSERRRLGLRQSDLAALAGVSAQTVLTVEHGRLDGLTVRSVRAVASAAGIRLPFLPRSIRAAAVERQIDSRHAALVESVVARLEALGWQAEPEWSFNHFGERGSVDVKAWHEDAGSLLVVEVKSELRDVQATLHALDVKRRVVPRLVRAECDRTVRHVGVVMVLADVRAERDRVNRHGATFAAALPARTREVGEWLQRPDRDLRGVWFLQIPRTTLLTHGAKGAERVWRRGGRGGVPSVEPSDAGESPRSSRRSHSAWSDERMAASQPAAANPAGVERCTSNAPR